MDRYLCQLCNTIVTSSENHSCFFYKDNDNVYSLPQLDEMHKKHDEGKGKFTASSNDNSGNLCPEVIGNDNEESKQMNSLLTEDCEKVSILTALKRKRKYTSSSDETSSNSHCGNCPENLLLGSISNNRLKEMHLKNTYPSKMFKLEYRSKSCFREEFTRESCTAGIPREENDYETRPSTSYNAPSSAECEMPLKERKLYYFTNDKEVSMKSKEFATRQDRLKSQNISETSKLLFQSSFLPENKEPNKVVIDASRNSSNGNISPEATSRVNILREDVAAIEKPLVSTNDTNAVAGPSRIYPQLFRTGDKGKLACDLCHKKFIMKYELDRHYQSHINANDVAGPSGTLPPSIKHTVKRRLASDLCPKDFKQKSYLDRHYGTHSGEKPFVCDICNRAFSLKRNLQTHARTHTGEKPFMCNKCEKGFSQQVHLDNHCRIHTGQKPFVCDICKKAFSQKSSLQTHAWTHKSEKPFMCNKCAKGFPRETDLDRHYRTHTGEKPFVCDKCGRKFSMKCNLKTHVQTHTKGEK